MLLQSRNDSFALRLNGADIPQELNTFNFVYGKLLCIKMFLNADVLVIAILFLFLLRTIR